MKTFDGYKKRNLTDKDYALLAGGGHKALDTLFSALSSDTTNAIKITVGGTEKSISTSTLKTSLGLGSNAYTSTAYLPLAGGTMTGALNFKNGTWNLMGDDAYIGDCNVAGMIGIKGANAATPGFVLYDNRGTLLGKLYASNDTLNWSGGTIAATIFSGSAECLNNYTISDPNTLALKDNKVKWFARINSTSNGSSGYAGNNYGFPVANNANGILYLGTYPGKYGHQLGFSSNGNIYHRYQNGSDFPLTANGGSWSTLLTSTNYSSILDNRYYTETEINSKLGTYLPLAGGTMAGTALISWPSSGNWENSNNGVTFPVTRGGLQWSGQSDWIKLFSQETSNDNLNLVLQFGDDNSNGLSIRNASGTQTAFISATGYITAQFNGPLNGNASSATYLNVQYCRDDDSPSNKGLWNTIKNGTTNAITNRVRFYTIYGSYSDLGAPETYGELLEICSYNSNHWQPLLWFGAGTGGRLYYRNKDYNNDTWGAWRTLAWTSDIPTVTNYYWADQLITGSAKSNTTPTFGKVTISGTYPQIQLNSTNRESSIYYLSSDGTGWATGPRAWGVSGFGIGVYTSTNNGVKLTILDNGNTGIGTTSPGYKLQISGDSYTTGWSRAANGFYVEGTGVHFTHQGSVGEIDMTSNNEFLWGSSSTSLYFNYRTVSRGTTVNNYIWNAGSSTSWASHTLGNLTSMGNQTLHGLTSTCNSGNSASYTQAAVQIREYNFGGAQSDTWGNAPRLAWHWSGRVQAQIGLASDSHLYISEDGSFSTPRLILHSGNSYVTGGKGVIAGTTITQVSNAGYAGYSGYTLSLNSVNLPSSESNSYNTVWCKFATITFNASAWCNAAGYIFFSGGESSDYKGILEYHFRAGRTASELGIAQLSWIIKSHDYATVIAVKTANNVYDFYTNNCSTWSTPRIYHFSAYNDRFKWNVGSWSTTKPTAAYTASDIGRVYYSTNAGNAGSSTIASTVTVNSSDSNSTYRMVWHSGNTLYGTGGIYCNPYSDCIYASHYYETSDIRYKRILKNLSINSNTIATLPLFDFEWVENNTIGTGTSALAVLQILPNLVSGTDKLTLDYGVLGTIAGITACKELVNLKSEINLLKERIELLELQLKMINDYGRC